ncbi:MAG TPA: N-acetylmuramoyl-L-alanine amidase [Thermoanaerobaculia bacterium]|nr:N-acetylmuramoyl-L-alanine amidase [Thermoanaerobaculia bacterium]
MKRIILVVVVLLFASAAYARRLDDVEARSLDAIFLQAADESGVPVDILRAIAFVESRWSPHPSVADDETGQPASYGIMGLRDDDWFGHSLVDAAAMIGRTPDELKRDHALNIRGAAALLAILGRGSVTIEDWEEAVAKYSGIPQPEVARIYTYDVFNAIREGRESERYRVERQPVDMQRIYGAERLEILSAPRVTVKVSALSADYSPALWNPAASCNYTVGRTVPVTHVTIHTAEGSYAGTISWFQNCSAQVSAHYVVRSSDGQITQMVLERDKAWHVGSENGYTVGIEHEGFMSAPSTWFTDAMYDASALLTRDICTSNGIDKTKVYDGSLGWNAVISDKAAYTVKGHVNYPSQTHQDPGSGWNWPRYRSLVAGTSGGSSQLLLNPGFESGNVSWVAAAAGDITNSASRTPHGGSWYAWLGGWATAHTDWMYQTATIPSTATTATLTFWLKVDTAETTTTTAYDTLKVQIRDTANVVKTQLVTLSNLSASCCYAQKSFDVSAYRGQTVRVYFEANNDNGNQTSFVVDDAAVNVQ